MPPVTHVALGFVRALPGLAHCWPKKGSFGGMLNAMHIDELDEHEHGISFPVESNF